MIDSKFDSGSIIATKTDSTAIATTPSHSDQTPRPKPATPPQLPNHDGKKKGYSIEPSGGGACDYMESALVPKRMIRSETVHVKELELDKPYRSVGTLSSDIEQQTQDQIMTTTVCMDTALTLNDHSTILSFDQIQSSKIPKQVSSVDEALENLGSFGAYQWQISVLLMAIYCCGNLCVYPMAFYQLQPQYQCRRFDKDA